MNNIKLKKQNLKFTIQGFNQLEAIKLGLTNDDLTVLRWFIDFRATGKMEKNYIEKVNDMGHWVNYATLAESLPILLKDGHKYLEEYIELEKAYYQVDEKTYKKLYKKYMEKHLKKIQRILSGNLSKVLKRDFSKLGEDKGTKVYLYVDEDAYSRLVSNTTIDDFLKEKGLDVPDKSVQSTPDKSVQSDSSTNYSSTNYSSTTESEQNVPVVETNKELIETKTHLVLETKNKIYKVSKWDKARLEKTIEIFKKQDGQYFALLEKIYKDDKNFAPKSNSIELSKPKTRYHNINQTFNKYEECELEDLLRENQRGKFNNLIQEDESNEISNYIEQAIADLQSETTLKVENNSIWKNAIEDRARELMILDSF